MGSFYDNSILPQHLRRDFDVYDRIKKIDLDLGTFEQWMEARPELTKMLENIQLSQNNNTIHQPSGISGEAQAQYA